MHYTIVAARGYLRAELFGRETQEQTREFLAALGQKALESGVTRVLVWVRNSRPIFKAATNGVAELFALAGSQSACRIALLGDSDELRFSQQYIELLARQQGARVRAFRDEAAALAWLRAESP